jgi:uncharacterized protein YggE
VNARFLIRTATAALSLLLPAVAVSQSPAPATVSAIGTTELRRHPEALRVQIELLTRGKSVEEALAKMKERRAAVRTQLTGLGATKDSIVFADNNLSSEKTEQQLQMEKMGRRGGSREGKAAKTKQAPPVVISSVVTAEFPLAGADSDAVLAAVHGFQQKVKAADIGGLKRGEHQTAQEDEIDEEMALAGEAMDPGEVKRGEPMFLFVCKLSEADRAKARAEAFAKAKRDAENLARAAGARLGELNTLSGQSAPGADFDEVSGMSRAMYYSMRHAIANQEASGIDSGEAVSPAPGKITVRVSVSATFNLRPAAAP